MHLRHSYDSISISGLRIAVGGIRQRTQARLHAWRTLPHVRRAAAPTLAALRQIKNALPADTPLIGILLAEHLGDIVACEPVIPFLNSRHPRACIVWLTKPMYASLVATHPLLHAVVPLNSVAEARVVIEEGCLDQAYDLHLPGKPCSRFHLVHAKKRGDLTLNTTNYFDHGALLTVMSRSAGLPGLEAPPRLYIGRAARTRIDALGLPKRFVAIHALSSQSSNNWQASHWPALIEYLKNNYDGSVVEVGLKSVLPADFPGTINLCGKLSPIESAEVIARAETFIGVDSGPAHCANAFEIPSVIMLGKYHSFVRYMPYTGYFRDHEHTMLLRSDTRAADLPVDAVLSRLERVLPLRRPVVDFSSDCKITEMRQPDAA